MAELCSTAGWKVEFVNYELGYLPEETSKQGVEGVTWFLLAANSKNQEEREKMRTELLNKKELALADLGKF